MILSLFRKSAQQRLIDRLHGEIVAAARRPELYLDLAIADTFEGRFEALVLHVCLVWRRLRQLDAPGRELGQHLVDTLFAHFDIILREAGVGDPAVPKRMKKLAEAFYGRRAAYDAALDSSDSAELEAALARNVYGATPVGGCSGPAPRLAAYVRRVVACLALNQIDELSAGSIHFPEPAADAREARA